MVVEAYLDSINATQAALRAGYGGGNIATGMGSALCTRGGQD
jgi:phage terminase small subunit